VVLCFFGCPRTLKSFAAVDFVKSFLGDLFLLWLPRPLANVTCRNQPAAVLFSPLELACPKQAVNTGESKTAISGATS
jgi:hypothetical protein